jgi:membrane-associated phospholipid phosphatase
MIFARRPTSLLVGLAALTVLLYLVLRTPAPPAFDTEVHRWILHHRHAWVTTLATSATFVGSSPVLYAVLVVGATLLWWRQRRAHPERQWQPVICLGVFVTGQLLRTGLADLLHRSRPPRGDWISTATGWSMPSGHSANSTLAALLVLWCVWDWLPSRAARLWSVATAVLFAGAVGWSRAYLGVHWPTDVLAGWLFAACWAGLAVMIIHHRMTTPPAGAAG